MRFDRRQSNTTPYFNRRDQMRMLMLVGMLMVVVLAAQHAAKPSTWKWMFPNEPNHPPAANSEESESADQLGEFSLVEDTDDSSRDSDPRDEPPSDSHEEGDPELPDTLRQELKQKVSDGSVGVRAAERETFFHVLEYAKSVEPERLNSDVEDGLTYAILMDETSAFRGQAIHLRGTLRRLQRTDAVSNDAGVAEFWEGWMMTEDSGLFPYRIIAANVSEELPTGMEIEVPVEFSGYLFKREAYESNDGVKETPTLIGPTIQPLIVRTRPREVEQSEQGLIPYVIGLAVAIAIGLSITLWRFRVSDRRFGDRHVQTFIAATPESMETLRDLDFVDPGEALRKLAEGEESEA